MAENREEILANFQGITAIEDVAEAIYHLEEANWDLLAAINRVMPQDASSSSALHDNDTHDVEMIDDDISVITPKTHPPDREDRLNQASTSTPLNFNPIPIIELQVHCNNKVHEVKISGNSTVGDLKKELENKCSVPVCRQQLSGLGGSRATNNATLMSLNLPQNAVLRLKAAENLMADDEDSGALKTCWENMKKMAKQVNTMRNQYHLGTGGGPPKKFAEDPATERVLELIQSRVTGFVNQFDSDGTLVLVAGTSTAEAVNSAAEAINSAAEAERDATSEILDYQFETEVQTESADANTCTLTADWSQYNQNMLREPRNPVLGRSPSPDVELREPEVQNLLPTVQTPLSAPRSATTYARTTRRRPVLRRDQEQSLNAERIKTLLTTNAYAEEEHRLNIKILQLQEESEKEKLKQEKYKTEQEKIKLEILKLELEKLKE